MKTRYVLALVGVAALVVAACSSSTTYTIAGTCGPLNVASNAVNPALLDISGPCTLGPAGDFAIGAVAGISLGATGAVPVSIDAGFVQGGGVLFSTFTGTADIPTPVSFIGLSGSFTFSGGTNQFSDATGSATMVDGGVTVSASGLTASFGLNGSVTY